MEKSTTRITGRRGLLIAAGAFAAALLITLPLVFLRGGDESTTVATDESTTVATDESTTGAPTTTSTTAAPTTTVAVVAPPNGVYIVDPEEFPNGFMLWGTDMFSEEDAGAMGLGWTAVGYSLPEGSEIVAPFDGTLLFYDSTAASALVVNQVPYAKISVESADERIMVYVGGPGLTYSSPGPVEAGAVIARVTDRGVLFAGLEDGSINTIIQFGRYRFQGNFEAWFLDISLLHDYFGGLPRYP